MRDLPIEEKYDRVYRMLRPSAYRYLTLIDDNQKSFGIDLGCNCIRCDCSYNNQGVLTKKCGKCAGRITCQQHYLKISGRRGKQISLDQVEDFLRHHNLSNNLEV